MNTDFPMTQNCSLSSSYSQFKESHINYFSTQCHFWGHHKGANSQSTVTRSTSGYHHKQYPCMQCNFKNIY